MKEPSTRKNRTTEQKKEEILVSLKQNFAVTTIACRKTGIGRTQFYEWKKSDPTFAKKVDEINERAIDYVESLLVEKIAQKDRTSIIFFLKAKAKDRGYV